jgi:hypothetical protein
MAESVIVLFKTELHRNPATLARNGGHWRGLDDVEIATCSWASSFNDERLHGELRDLTQQRSKTATTVNSLRPPRPEKPTDRASGKPARTEPTSTRVSMSRNRDFR